MTAIVTILKDREKPIRNQHPWIFSGAISSAKNARNGDIVTVVDHQGNFLGAGYFNQKSQIQVRLLTWHEEIIDEDWWRRAIQRAMSLRREFFPLGAEPRAFRLINAENDYLPGLIVDVYDQWLVVQAQTLFIDEIKQDLGSILMELTGAKGVFERSDVDVRGKEGLRDSVGMLAGEPIPDVMPIIEDGRHYQVNVAHGQKTGFYLDQRTNRTLLKTLLNESPKQDNQVLNLFSYTGGFGVAALQSDKTARVVNVDSSEEAIRLSKIAASENGAKPDQVDQVEADCFTYLRAAQTNGEMFDMIVCDPPKFASSAQQVEKAARGYKDLNLQSFKLLKENGLLLTFSCSGAINRDLFQKIVFGALADSGRQGQILQHLSASSDHPVALTFPEGEYLKGLLVRVI